MICLFYLDFIFSIILKRTNKNIKMRDYFYTKRKIVQLTNSLQREGFYSRFFVCLLFLIIFVLFLLKYKNAPLSRNLSIFMGLQGYTKLTTLLDFADQNKIKAWTWLPYFFRKICKVCIFGAKHLRLLAPS